MEKNFAELWHTCYPRRYNELGATQYDSPKSVARAMLDAFLSFHMSDMVGTTEQNEALWASTMVKYGVPTYYLSHDMAVALTKTTPPKVIDCLDIALPFPAAAFMLPVGILNHPEYGPISFVAYTRNLGGSCVNCPHPVPAKRYNLNCVNSSFTVFMRTVSGKMLHWTYDTALRMVDLKNQEELIELQKRYSHTSRLGYESQRFTPADILSMNETINFIFNVLLLMMGKPELVERGQLLKRIKGVGRPIEYWSPHVIGRTYKLRYENHDGTHGTHASPHGHWVAGFWREQPYGPHNSLRRPKLIDPYWRGGKLV
jgi:hypothetical protein